MKIKRIIFFSLIFLGIILISNSSEGFSSGATYFNGEALKLDVSTKETELLSNEITIDEETSKIQNNYIFANKTDKEILTKASIKLEDPNLGTTVDDLKISINGTTIEKYMIDNEGICTFAIKILPKEGIQIKISYTNGSDLKNAKVIKYTLDNYKKSHIKKFTFKVHFVENSVPLVEKIYPNCYNYDLKQDISVEYYDFDVNNLTKDFIVQKETYKNLLYVRADEFDEEQIDVIKKTKNGEPIELESDKWGYLIYKKNRLQSNDYAYKTIYLYKLLEKEEIVNSDSYFKMRRSYNWYEIGPLVYDLSAKINGFQGYGTKVALDYVLSEGDKKLYVHKTIVNPDGTLPNDTLPDYDASAHEKDEEDSEINILKTKIHRNNNSDTSHYGVRYIEINQTIDGAYIEATDKEKAEYVNMIEADTYVRIAIYDGDIKNGKTSTLYDGSIREEIYSAVVGYYNEEDKELAKKYLIVAEYNYNTKTNNYKEISDDRLLIINFDNQDIKQYSKVPTLSQIIGYKVEKDEKNFIEIFQSYFTREGYGVFSQIIESDRGQELITTNKSANTNIKNTVNTEINNLKFSEYKESVEEDISNSDDDIKNTKNENFAIFGIVFTTQSLIILGSCIAVIIILFIIIIVIAIKRKRQSK